VQNNGLLFNYDNLFISGEQITNAFRTGNKHIVTVMLTSFGH